MLEHFAHKAIFSDELAEKIGMQARLKMNSLTEDAINEVADFIQASRDPMFKRDIEKALRESSGDINLLQLSEN